MAKTKKSDNGKCDENVEQLENFYFVVRNVKWHHHCRKAVQ